MTWASIYKSPVFLQSKSSLKHDREHHAINGDNLSWAASGLEMVAVIGRCWGDASLGDGLWEDGIECDLFLGDGLWEDGIQCDPFLGDGLWGDACLGDGLWGVGICGDMFVGDGIWCDVSL